MSFVSYFITMLTELSNEKLKTRNTQYPRRNEFFHLAHKFPSLKAFGLQHTNHTTLTTEQTKMKKITETRHQPGNKTASKT